MTLIEQIKTVGDIRRVAELALFSVTRENFILSPFKLEKTPSCKLYPETNSFKCYATGEGGSIIDLYIALHQVDLKTALRELAAMFRLSDEEFKQRNYVAPVPNAIKKEENLFDAMSEDEKYLYDERSALSGLVKGLEAVKIRRMERNSEVYEHFYSYCMSKGFPLAALRYLEGRRGLNRQTIKKFRLFSFENYYEVNMHLKRVFGLERLWESGLFNKKEDGSGNLIFAKHRIIIPYLFKGKIVYLRGRYFDEEANPNTDRNKYLGLRNDALGVNTPKRFYNLDTLSNAFDFEPIYITEGEFDAMVLEQHGFYAMGVPGASNIPQPLSLHKLKGRNVVLVPDNDEAGEMMREKFVNELENIGVSVRVKKIKSKDITEFFVGR